MKLWRFILPILLFGALFRASSEDELSPMPTLRASAYASEIEEAFVAVCDHIGSMPCELPVLRTNTAPVWTSVTRTGAMRTAKNLKPEVGARVRGSWSAPINGSYHLAFFAEPRPVARLRVLRRLRI